MNTDRALGQDTGPGAAPPAAQDRPPAARAAIASVVILAPSAYPAAAAISTSDATALQHGLLWVLVAAVLPWIARLTTSPLRVVLTFAAVAVCMWPQAVEWAPGPLILLAFATRGRDDDFAEPGQGLDVAGAILFAALALGVLLRFMAPFVAAWSLRTHRPWFGRLMTVLAGACVLGGTIPLALHQLYRG